MLRGATAETRYLSKLVTPDDPDACWGWLGGLTPEGYGRFMWDLPGGGRGQLAHRFGWEHHHGPIPDGAVIDHTCHDPRTCADGRACPHRACQNPAHWALVAPLANTATDRRRNRSDNTHCKRGHEFTVKNTYVATNRQTGRTWRMCRTCQRERRGRPPVGSTKPGPPRRTHCKHGHEFTAANTYEYTDRNGWTRRECRTCRTAAAERARKR